MGQLFAISATYWVPKMPLSEFSVRHLQSNTSPSVHTLASGEIHTGSHINDEGGADMRRVFFVRTQRFRPRPWLPAAELGDPTNNEVINTTAGINGK